MFAPSFCELAFRIPGCFILCSSCGCYRIFIVLLQYRIADREHLAGENAFSRSGAGLKRFWMEYMQAGGKT
jgi:hypothetical protein